MITTPKKYPKFETDQVYLENGAICIHQHSRPVVLPLSEVDTAKKLLMHTHNQLSKVWMTTDIVFRFIELAIKENDITW